MKGLELTEISISPVRNKSAENPIEAFAKIVLNEAFAVSGIKVIKGKFGLFVSFPREYNKTEGAGYSICYPITKSLQEYMSSRILEEYEKAVTA